MTTAKAEKTALAAETKLDAIFRASRDLYFHLSPDGTILDYHAGRPQDLYAPPEEFLGRRVEDVLPPETGSRIHAAVGQALASNEMVILEFTLPTEYGRQSFEARLLPLAGRQVAAIVRNVTEQRRTDEALRLVEERFHSIFRNVAAGMVLTFPDGRLMEVNPAFCHCLGYTMDELMQLTADDITHPADREETRRLRCAALSGEKRSFTLEKRFLRKDGATVWAHVSSTWFYDRDGSPIYCAALVQDITERKRMEDALRESEVKFAKAFHAIPTWLVISTLEGGRFIEINEAFERICGFRRDEVIGRTSLELQIWKNPSEREQMVRTLLAGGVVRDQEHDFVGKDGRAFVGLLSADLVEVNGEQCLITLVNDITERKKAEEALRMSEERFRRLYNETPVMLHSIDRNGRLVSVSDYWLEVLGYERSEVIGRRSTDFLSEESRRHAEQSVLPDYYRTGFCKDVPYQFVTRGGEKVDVLLSATAERNTAGEIIRSLAVMADVTERNRAEEALRESEEKFARAFLSTPNILVISSMERGRYIEVNEAFENAFGYRREEAIGLTSLELNIWEDPQDRSRYVQMLRKEGKVRGMECNFRSKSGNLLFGQLSGEIIVLDGEPCILSQVNDITTRKQMAERIEILNTDLACRAAELAAANEELEAFSFTVSHDLRSPLTGINGYSQLLLELSATNHDDQYAAYLREIHESACRMEQMIGTMLDFARLSRGAISRETVDLSAMAQAVAAELALQEPEREVTFSIASGVTAYCDSRLLRVVLQNLLGNSWKYTGTVKSATIAFGVTDAGGKPAYFVRDNGAGFDMAKADQLFKPFQRLHGAGEFGGHGIGLATVQRIIHRHGGRVWAEGSVGEGATVYFTL